MSILNFAQKSNFLCSCSLYPDIRFYLQSVNLPGISFTLSETKSLNLAHFVASTDHSYGSLSFSVLLDEDYKIYDFFMNEMLRSKSLINPTYAQRDFETWIEIYNNKGNLLFTENFHNCMIESISDISLSSTDNGVVDTMDIGIKFDWLDISYNGIKDEKRREFNVYPPKTEANADGDGN